LRPGRIELDSSEARHLRDVLRLTQGDAVELFDDAGRVGVGTIIECAPASLIVEVKDVTEPTDVAGVALTIAAAVPKGERADWMIEKLSELGVARFIPLAADRGVVLPEGKNKRDRWLRIAIESAKQSRRRGVMEIAELTQLTELLKPGLVGQTFLSASGRRPESSATTSHGRQECLPHRATFHLSTSPDAAPIRDALTSSPRELTLLIGPEGGWTDAEIALFAERDIRGVKLTDTILRVETAAVAAAAVVGVLAI
jgi:16S rRNA (uracil1498-N3)-methyltransferase